MRNWFLALLPFSVMGAAPEVDPTRLAARIAGALALQPGERVLMHVDPACFSELRVPLEQAIRKVKGVSLSALLANEPLNERQLEPVDVFIRLPLGASARQLSEAEERVLIRWLEKGGTRRELHFHWADGTRDADGLLAVHPREFDALYARALEIDYAALNAAQERAIALFRLGTVRIHTPAGTDLMFRIAKRPFNKQNGNASGARARSAQVRVDRHIELPAGVLRVAPVEGSVSGQLVLPEARFGDTIARRVVIQVDNGRISRVRADEGLEAVQAVLAAGGESAMQFREFALGFNPELSVEPGSRLVPYYGYGTGVVRVSFGDNEELGGTVRGDYVRWFFLTDATLHVDYRYVLKNGTPVTQ